MKVEIRYPGTYAVAKCHLSANETINVESGALYAHSEGITVDVSAQGGLLSAAKRAFLSGDSFFVSKFTASRPNSWIDLVPKLPGDLFNIDVEPGTNLVLNRGVWVASEQSVNLDPKFGSKSSVLGGQGISVIQASGSGVLVGSAYGAIDIITLSQGQTVTIDTGHLVAFEESMNVRVRPISNAMNSLKSGEGLVMDITGPGDVILQTRNPSAFGSWAAGIVSAAK